MINLKENPFYLDEKQISWVEDTLSQMTDDEKLEQLFFPLLFNLSPDYLEEVIRKYNFAGIMFRSNDKEIVSRSVSILQDNARIPLLMAANLEDGGNGIVSDGTYMGRPMLAAATGDIRTAERLGIICGKEGNAVGINLSFSPVVDLDLNFRNPITNVRTYGNNTDQVLRMARAYCKGLEEQGVHATIKHFPGDGVDERDQHLLTSVNTLSMDEWRDRYGKIYDGMIQDGIKALMVGHIAMPAMEEEISGKPCEKVIPASVSRNIVSGYLREKMGYNGLVITDASPMVGLAAVTKRREAVPLSIENGCDLFLFTREMDEDVRYMKDGFKNGLLSRNRLDEAVTRILAMKASMNLVKLKEAGLLNPDEEKMSVIGNEQHQEWAKQAADEGVTLVKDRDNLLPLSTAKTPRILLQIIGGFDSNERVLDHFQRLLENEGFQVSRYVPETIATIFNDSSIELFKSKYDLVVYIGNIENASNQTVARIQWHTLFGAGNNIPWFAKEVPTVFMSVGNPYHLFDVPMIGTYINGYCHAPNVIEMMMEKVMGRSDFKGKSPIDPFCGHWDTVL